MSLAGACDMLDEVDARVSMLSDLLGAASCDELCFSPSGVLGLAGLMREILSRIVVARAEIDRARNGSE